MKTSEIDEPGMYVTFCIPFTGGVPMRRSCVPGDITDDKIKQIKEALVENIDILLRISNHLETLGWSSLINGQFGFRFYKKCNLKEAREELKHLSNGYPGGFEYSVFKMTGPGGECYNCNPKK